MFLTPEEIEQLTGRKRPSAQRRMLRKMRIDILIRPDGGFAVLRSAVEPKAERTAEWEPNWDAAAQA